MNKIIKLLDTSLRDGEQSPGCTMNISEKLQFAIKLEQLGIDIIEAGFPVSSEGDYQSVKSIAAAIKNAEVCALSRAIDSDIQVAYNAISKAAAPRLHIFLATSDIHLEHKLKLSREQVLERIASSIKFAKSLLSNVQFSFEDATRSDVDFLAKAASVAIASGATTINFADTVGYSCPRDIEDMLGHIHKSVDLSSVNVGMHCHNDLGMAVANSLTAISCGCNHIEGTINGIGERAGNAALEEIVMALVAKPQFNATTRVKTQEIYSTSRMLSSILGMQIPAGKPIVGANVFLHESGIHQHGVMLNRNTYEIITPESIGVPKQQMLLGKHSGKHAFEDYLKEIGVKYTSAQLAKHFRDFKALCDKKKNITRLDIEALITGIQLTDNKNNYSLTNFLIATKKDGAFSTITLSKDGKHMAYQAEGNGALDSSFSAVNRIMHVDFKLIDYSLHAVTGGEDALGEAVVKLTDGTTTITGKGLSTDIVEASILAYLDAANKLLSPQNL